MEVSFQKNKSFKFECYNTGIFSFRRMTRLQMIKKIMKEIERDHKYDGYE